MTPAERASAVAFALKNCALEAMMPGEATLRAAVAYEQGIEDVSHLIDVADEQTAMRLHVAEGKGGDRLSDGSLDDHATDRADAVFARTVLLAERRWNPSGDLDELVAIHKGLFEGVFDDAGKLRTASTTREVTNDRALAANPEAFFPAVLIETGALNIATELADKRNLHAMDRDVFVHAFSVIYDELGYLHPFRGGNAMVLRIFGSRLAHDAGWDLDWGEVTREAYRTAKHTAYRGDLSAFERLFDGMLRPANPTRVFLIAGWDQGPAH
ncbi:cell filamentation protein Fic [Bifidobacterium callitrichidarum]|uniref:protein adenylyltransferase n=2 Tax=Bifidobacterium callitrichidarum TaxID=2052941 RepID=A0A2U2N6I1_9BIFI|nr:cell filamentation protein Fic [Bifidobacterium callitrichidarum]